jgi:sugar/nucleoside kinase (ribokinase family)
MDTIWKLDSKARPRGASNYATVQTNVGGVGANLAIAVARSDLSRRPTFITTLGDDSPGAFLEDRLARELDLIKVNRRNDFFFELTDISARCQRRIEIWPVHVRRRG